MQSLGFTLGFFMFEIEIEALSKRRIAYPLDRLADATVVGGRQPMFWGLLAETLRRTPVTDAEASIMGRVIKVLKSTSDLNHASIETTSNHKLIGKLPLLTEESSEKMRRKCAELPIQTAGVIFGECAADFFLLYIAQNKDMSDLQVMSEQPFSFYATQYCIEKALANSQFVDKTRELSDLAVQSLEQVKKHQVLYEKFESQIEAIPLTATEAIDVLRAKNQEDFSSFIKEIDIAKTLFFEAAGKEKEAALAAFSETHAFKSALNTWKDKAERHASAFNWGFSSLCGVVVAGLAGLVYWFPPIVEGFARLKKPDGDFPHITILLFLLPMIAVGWLFRIGGKLVTGALILKNDAEQRLALLETYIRLVHDAKAGREDRTIVLAALFRPLPGHENDDLQPPSLLDLMKKEK